MKVPVHSYHYTGSQKYNVVSNAMLTCARMMRQFITARAVCITEFASGHLSSRGVPEFRSDHQDCPWSFRVISKFGCPWNVRQFSENVNPQHGPQLKPKHLRYKDSETDWKTSIMLWGSCMSPFKAQHVHQIHAGDSCKYKRHVRVVWVHRNWIQFSPCVSHGSSLGHFVSSFHNVNIHSTVQYGGCKTYGKVTGNGMEFWE